MERIEASDLLRKIKTQEDKINFFREQGNSKIKIIGLYFPKKVGFDGKFFLQVLRGEKQVSNLFFRI